jgi:TolB-like protein/Flp pilus assembly protein TadD
MQQQDRLTSWKEIAAYLNVTVRTAQRWERAEHLPIRRHRHAALSSVFAYRSELESWWNNRPALRQPAVDDRAAMPSIAVLPFVNLSGDQSDDILSDGLTEELINALTRVDGLHVIARTSVFHFKGRTGDVRAVAARLGVATVLEGSVRRSGKRLRITAQLINAIDGCHLWSERYDRRAEDLLDLEEELAHAITSALRVKLVGPGLIRHYTRDPASYELYLEGRYNWNKRSRQGLLRAIGCFEQVLSRDARMAPAWAGLADCYSMLQIAGMPAGEFLGRAKAAALKALEIDSDLAEAHTSLGFLRAVSEYDWTGAESAFQRALALNPDHANSHLLYSAVVLGPAGRLDENEVHLKRACELDPYSAVMRSGLGMHFLVTRQFDRAIAAARGALELDPEYPWAHRIEGQACLLTNRFDEAVTPFSKIEEPALAAGFLGYCYARKGKLLEARQLLLEMKRRSGPLACQLAVLHLGLRNLDAAFASLNEACGSRSVGVIWVKVDPIWDDLRPDPRFAALLKRMGLGNGR